MWRPCFLSLPVPSSHTHQTMSDSRQELSPRSMVGARSVVDVAIGNEISSLDRQPERSPRVPSLVWLHPLLLPSWNSWSCFKQVGPTHTSLGSGPCILSSHSCLHLISGDQRFAGPGFLMSAEYELRSPLDSSQLAWVDGILHYHP